MNWPLTTPLWSKPKDHPLNHIIWGIYISKHQSMTIQVEQQRELPLGQTNSPFNDLGSWKNKFPMASASLYKNHQYQIGKARNSIETK